MNLNLQKSAQAFEEAKKCIPGGVNSPVRSYRSVGCNPPFIEKAKGSKIYDIDGNCYIDYVGSWGPMIVGHAHDKVVAAIKKAAELGTSYGAPTVSETELVKKVQSIMPSMQLMRLVNSGTEATMSALRVARGFTRRDKIIKFIGCYHGHHDSLLVKAGSGAATFGVPDSPGVSADVVKNTISLPYNDIAALKDTVEKQYKEIAAVIIEPVAGNMGLVLPDEAFLESLREITHKYGIVLIFDEVMCGFRASLGGAQKKYNIIPDLTCLGKIIGGGLPVGAYGGRREIMEMVSPSGPVYQAGTLSGNPLAMASGIATLDIIMQKGYIEEVEAQTTYLVAAIKRAGQKIGVPLQVNQAGSMFGFFFTDKPVRDYEAATSSNLEAFNMFFLHMLAEGVYMAPSQFETLFMSGAHSEEDLAKTIAATESSLEKVAKAIYAK